MWYVEPTLKSLDGFAADKDISPELELNKLLDAPDLAISAIDKMVERWERVTPRITYKQAWDMGIPQSAPSVDLHATPYFTHSLRRGSVVYCPRLHHHYYTCVCHEYTHSTGPAQGRPFYSVPMFCMPIHMYAQEEMIAELGSSMLLTAAGYPDLFLAKRRSYLQAWGRQGGSLIEAVLPAIAAVELLLKK